MKFKKKKENIEILMIWNGNNYRSSNRASRRVSSNGRERRNLWGTSDRRCRAPACTGAPRRNPADSVNTATRNHCRCCSVRGASIGGAGSYPPDRSETTETNQQKQPSFLFIFFLFHFLFFSFQFLVFIFIFLFFFYCFLKIFFNFLFFIFHCFFKFF